MQRGHLTGDPSAASTPQAIIDRRELAFIAVERTRMPMVVTDPRQADNPIVMANAAFMNATGYSVEEVIGRNCRFLQGEATDLQAIDEVRRAVREERTLTLEVLNYRKNGSSFWNELHLSPIYDDEGHLIYFFASQLDVSERRHARELELAEHRLMLEIEHRAKNTLAMVQGIVRLSRGATVDEYAASVQGRVDVLAQAHDLLAQARWCDIPLQQIIHSMTAVFGPRVVVSGPQISIPPGQVQPLALVLHEIISNAARHGALASDTGILSIDWRPDRDQTQIELKETGNSSVETTSKPGVGIRVIEALVTRQLGGRIARLWQSDGVTTTIRLPQLFDQRALPALP